MALTAQEILQVMKEAKELGFNQIKVEGLELSSQINKAPSLPVEELPAEDIVKPMSVLDELSEEEILYYSTPYYDELQAKKESQKEHAKLKQENS